MQLFVLRHGHAESQQTTDEARNLTAKGRADVTANALRSLRELTSVESVWVSSLVRAQQTAQIVLDLLVHENKYPAKKTTDLIVPEAAPQPLFDELLSANSNAILLVSHQPFVGKFIDLLCGAPAGSHAMETSSLACIDCDIPAAGLGRLRWLRHVHGE